MTFLTRAEIVTKVTNELVLVAGSSVQTYQQPIIEDYIQNAFDHLFSKRFWEHLTMTTFHTLDGVVGVVTDTIASIDNHTDIKWIRRYPYAEGNEIPYFSDGLFDTTRDGYSTLHYTNAQWATKRFQFNPITEAIQIAIRARRKPDNFTEGSTVPFDSLMITHLVAANMLAADGMNAGAQQREQALFDDRYDTLVGNEADQPVKSNRNRWAREFTVAPEV